LVAGARFGLRDSLNSLIFHFAETLPAADPPAASPRTRSTHLSHAPAAEFRARGASPPPAPRSPPGSHPAVMSGSPTRAATKAISRAALARH
jgi:hypothetical protein